MSLTSEQKQAVAAWVAAGDNLSAVQKKLSEQFKISMTYRDVRFLVDDLELTLKDPAPKVDASDVSKVPPPARPAPGGGVPPPRNAEKKIPNDALNDNAGLPPDGMEDDALPPEGVQEEAGDYADEPVGAGQVSVELDRIVRPGFMVSGNVTFTDGVSCKWALDQMGRLMLETPQKGYQPSAPDVQAFQRELQAQLQRQGF